MLTCDDYIDKAQYLVPAPVILSSLLPLLRQPNIDCNKVVDLISHDQPLTANVLRICNSAYFCPDTPIDNLQYAVMRIGFHLIYDIVVSVIFSSTLHGAKQADLAEANALWDHSVTTAVAAVRYHHQPAAAEGYQQLTACVHLGDFIAYSIGHGHGLRSFDLNERGETLEILKISTDHILQYTTQASETLQQVKDLYQIS
ncbi:MAG TPA: HDOD domain-containing protein [Verrucomicrobiae bacterium]|nr:HDOD domain-containing protein [Verrucomicrobiae bacterium]